MECREVRVLLTGLADGELDPVREEQVRGHTEKCIGCARALRDERLLKEAVSRLPMPGVPPSLKKSIDREIRTRTRPRQRVVRFSTAAAAAAVLVALVLSGRPVPAAPEVLARHEIASLHRAVSAGCKFCSCCSDWKTAFRAHARNLHLLPPKQLKFVGYASQSSEVFNKKIPVFSGRIRDRAVSLFVLDAEEIRKLRLKPVGRPAGRQCFVLEGPERSFVAVCGSGVHQVWVADMKSDDLLNLVAAR